MSKAFVIGGAVGAAGATRMAQSDLSAGTSNVIDDTSGMGSRTVIPNDPDRVITADVDAGPGGGTKGTVRAGDDYKYAGRQAPEAVGTQRMGDDWKFAGSAQGSVAPVEGSPEATAADIAAGGGSSAARSINDDPDGFLAANANADTSGSAARGSAINDDPDGFLAANANADLSGGTSTGVTAFVDSSEDYLTKVGYDASAATSAVTDAHDRAGDNVVTRIADDASDSSSASAASEQEPNISS